MPFPIQESSPFKSPLSRIITQEQILDNLPAYQEAISFYRAYPDKLIDLYIQTMGEGTTFALYDYQRLLLRAFARHKIVFATFSRGTSKSFVNTLWKMVECILYPGTKSAITATTKGQSGEILKTKVQEILNLLPILRFEIRKEESDKDSYIVHFKNGSQLRNLAAKSTSRGLRFTSLTLEEVIEADPQIVQEVILPTLAIQRRAANGEFNVNETTTQQRVFVTTAGEAETYAYHSLIRALLTQLTEPKKAIVLGGSFMIPVAFGLQNLDFVKQQKNSGELTPNGFLREYMSRWVRNSAAAFFSTEAFDRSRSIQEPKFGRETNLTGGAGYVMGIDVGRLNDLTEVVIWRYQPQNRAASIKSLVYLRSLEKMHFTKQAVEIKRIYERFLPEKVVIDGTGLGVGLIDELIKEQTDEETGTLLAAWGVSNDDKGYYIKFKTMSTIPDVLYIVKANPSFNSEMYANYRVQLSSGRLRFLTDERKARLAIAASRAKRYKEMTDDEKEDIILQHSLTSSLRTQLGNLRSRKEGMNVALDQENKSIKKDRVSASGYPLWYIKVEIDDRMMSRSRGAISDLLGSLNSGGGGPARVLNLSFRSNRDYKSRRGR